MIKIKLEFLNELSGGDAKFVSLMLKTYIEETSKELLLLEEAYQKKDRSSIAFWAHKIKTSFYLLGLEQLSAVASNLEQNAKNLQLSLEKLQEELNFISSNAADSINQAKKLIKAF
jgi:HPt (histidine-containing phosphotransfer) domain-containing protein